MDRAERAQQPRAAAHPPRAAAHELQDGRAEYQVGVQVAPDLHRRAGAAVGVDHRRRLVLQDTREDEVAARAAGCTEAGRQLDQGLGQDVGDHHVCFDVLRLIRRQVELDLVGYAISLALTPLAIAFYTPAEFGKLAVVDRDLAQRGRERPAVAVAVSFLVVFWILLSAATLLTAFVPFA